jgi:regulator of sigma E protease
VSNLILGFVLLFVMYVAFGEKYVAPVLAPVPGTAAESAGIRTGDILLAVDGETIPSFNRFESVSERKLGKEVELALRRGDERITVRYTVPVETTDIEPLLSPVIERVRGGSPAARIGLKPGDRIVAVADTPVTRWEDFVGAVTSRPGVRIPISWQHGDQVLTDSITPTGERDQMTEQRFGQIGVWVRLPKKNMSLPVAAWQALSRTGYVVVQTFVVLYKVVSRQISTKAIGGPIMVAKIAYEGASWGPEYFLALWSLLSINLFVVNMLPVPVLDGGHIALDIFGAIRRRRLSEREMTWAANIGWAMIGALILFTIFNDVLRLIRK